MRFRILFLSVAFATLFFTGCENIDNQLSRQEEQEGWMLLFDGKTLDGWRDFQGEGIQRPWKLESGLLTGLGKGSDSIGYLISEGQYENFVLTFNWKISEGGNSGVFYHVVERDIFKVLDLTGTKNMIKKIL